METAVQSFNLRAMLQAITRILPGTALALVIAVLAFGLQSWSAFSHLIPLGSLILALLFGVAVRNLVPLPETLMPGIRFAGKQLLRIAVILLGLKLSVSSIASVGPTALASILVVSSASLAFSLWVGSRLGLSGSRALLLAGGISICGASAVAALASASRAPEEDAAFAIGAVTLFGTAFMFAYPMMYFWLQLKPAFYALWVGTSVHEVAQVAVAGSVVPEALKGHAATVKMIRVLLIVPATLIVSIRTPKQDKPLPTEAISTRLNLTIPWFALAFFLVVVLNSLIRLPVNLHNWFVRADDFLMAAAMAALGLGLSLKSFLRMGSQALLAGVLGSIFIALFGAGILALMGLA